MKTKNQACRGGEYLLKQAAPADVFIPEDFDDELRMIAQTTEEYVEHEVRPVLDRLNVLEPGLSEQLMQKAGELGLLAIEIPEEYGGAQLSKTAATIVAEYSAGSSGFNTTISAHSTIGTLPLVYFGTHEQKQKYLSKLGSGEWVGAYALTEPEAGSDALGGRTTAVLSDDGKHYILNGSKMWISNAGFAKLFTVFAKVDGDRKKFSAFLVEHDRPGLSLGAEEKKMGIKSSSTRQVMFENVKIPVENLLGEIGQGAKIAFNILNSGRFKLGASCVGAVKRIIAMSAAYAQERKQFGVPIASFGLIREKLAEMAIRTYAAESATYRTIGMIDDMIGDDKSLDTQLKSIEEYAIECSFIKVLGSELIDFAVDEGVQIHGGYGYSADYEIERAYRDARINRIYEGTNEINRLIMPGMLLKRALRGELALFAQAGAQVEVQLPVLQQELQTLNALKKTAIAILGQAAKKYDKALENEQELLARIADMMMAIFAAESAILRTAKLHAAGKDSELFQALAQAYAAGAVEKCTASAREALSLFAQGEALHKQLAALAKIQSQPVNSIALRRTVADAVLKVTGYPVSG
ncbi:acyl-CoA dehydrogenase family protein [candidate division KSB1 bacterium]|nr:acyl-CoA dehydrogenase family protein [candidate division KSB1 bacterium]